MKPNYVFFDHNSLNVEAFKRIIGESESRFFIDCDVRDLVNDFRITVVVSPANSFGFMDGGIDKVYMELFPGIQTRVQDRIKQFNITTSLGRSVLPIGSALLVSTRDKKCPFLACVPTMFFPEKISETRNVYWSMLGLLILIECSLSEMKDVVVAIPCFGTGVGKMTPEAAAEQTREAIEQFAKITISQDMRQTIKKNCAYVLKKMACPQPNTYANTEASNLT